MVFPGSDIPLLNLPRGCEGLTLIIQIIQVFIICSDLINSVVRIGESWLQHKLLITEYWWRLAHKFESFNLLRFNLTPRARIVGRQWPCDYTMLGNEYTIYDLIWYNDSVSVHHYCYSLNNSPTLMITKCRLPKLQNKEADADRIQYTNRIFTLQQTSA